MLEQPRIERCKRCGKGLANRRGCCRVCYNRYAAMVGKGTTTWEELVAAGLVLPAAPHKLGLARWRRGQAN